jgi:hypothetical protein
MEDPKDISPAKGIMDQLQAFENWTKRMAQSPAIQLPPMPVNPNFASEFYSRLIKMIEDFDKQLDPNYDVGLRLVNFGQNKTFHLETLGYWNPSLIIFHGTTDEGEPLELIQHVTQISVLLTKVPRRDPSKPKKPIGFAPSEEDKKSGV